jgi:glycosyltransferase involved in cell wall biosynthesis
MKLKSTVRSLARIVKRPFGRRPRIIMTLLCRDEEDIVGYTIAHHLAQGVDFIIATDNASKDRTPLLLERFAQQGKLKLIREPSQTHDQSIWVTRMARMAAKKFDADWVINCDADEFWLPRTGTLRDALEAMPRTAESLAVPPFDMLPPPASGGKFFEAMVIRLTGDRSIHGTPTVSKACHRAYANVVVADGNHHVKRSGSRIPERSDHPIEIVHFPLRSLAQIERKVRQGTEALEANPRLRPSTTAHWRRLYHDYLVHGRLGEYYSECVPDAARISAGLADGSLVEDTRVRDVLRGIDPALADPGH